jgi:branched-chain amino acid aminotransferase
MASVRQLRMEIPMAFTMEFLEDQIRYTLKASNLDAGFANIIIWLYRTSAREYDRSKNGVGFIIEVRPIQSSAYPHLKADMRVDLFKDYFIHADPLSSLSFANGPVRNLANIFAKENGLDGMILLNHNKEVCEMLGGTLFAKMGDTWITPADSSGCETTVIRQELIKQWPQLDIEDLKVRPVSPFELQKADELFSISETYGFCSVTHYRKTLFKTDSTQVLAHRFNQTFFGVKS